ncbi:MAG: hypothetical protein IJ060_13475 [Oscillospiraceae bacterium]|nr:hypothetical protein [Oscillospiraceae bacterium]MBQ8923142.1 hypothetical protein [Oscillospiraceae bacterium]
MELSPPSSPVELSPPSALDSAVLELPASAVLLELESSPQATKADDAIARVAIRARDFLSLFIVSFLLHFAAKNDLLRSQL